MTSTVIFCKLKRTYGLVVKASCWVGFQQYAESLCRLKTILRGGTEPVSALTLSLVYCCAKCACYNFFFSNYGSGDLALLGF